MLREDRRGQSKRCSGLMLHPRQGGEGSFCRRLWRGTSRRNDWVGSVGEDGTDGDVELDMDPPRPNSAAHSPVLNRVLAFRIHGAPVPQPTKPEVLRER
jgi:hypothetical protein